MSTFIAPATSGHRWWIASLMLCLTLVFSACRNEADTWLTVDPAYSAYVDAYTSGVVSKTASVRIQLASQLATTHTVGEPVKEKLISIKPSVPGKAVWVDARTIEFKPDRWMEPDKMYQVSFELGKVAKVPEKYKTMKFSIQTIAPAFQVKQFGLRSTGTKEGMKLTGQIETADTEDSTTIEKILRAQLDGAPQKINWEHQPDARKSMFSIDQITRGAKAKKLDLRWDGSNADLIGQGTESLEVPAVGDFKVLQVQAVNEAQQYASVQFSDPIQAVQDLTGLLSIANLSDAAFAVLGSEVRLFASSRLDGVQTVQVSPGVKSVWDASLPSGYAAQVPFENLLPSVRMLGKGNILPHAGKLLIPFEAVNLRAVDITILRIYEKNVPQFLQSNDINGSYDLRRVARPVVQTTLRLGDDKALDLHRKQRFSIDIDKYLRTEPGAIYRVTLGFRPEYSLYEAQAAVTSSDVATDEATESESDEEEESYTEQESDGGTGDGETDDDFAFWNRYDTYYPYGYNWSRRDDPTSRSYYNRDRWAIRNVMASNIGLTAKRDASAGVLVVATDLRTAKPLSGIEVELLDYQQIVLEKGKTSDNGTVLLSGKRKGFLVVARQGNERGYLKIDDGSALPLSRFDVEGVEVRKGLKGFLFGERGVWRPGDSLFLNCIVEDKSNQLADDHPVEFSLLTPQGQVYRREVQPLAQDGKKGYLVFRTATDASAPTGSWLFRAKVGGAVFEKRIRVETIQPNRLKIETDFGKEPTLGVNGVTAGQLRARWLFGTPAKQFKAKVDMTLTKQATSFKSYANYTFDDPTTSFSPQAVTIFDGTLDEQGQASIKPVASKIVGAPGLLRAEVAVKVFEPGGAFSIDNQFLAYSPYASYVGVKAPAGEAPFNYLRTGRKHQFDIANVDALGKPIAGARSAEVMIYRVQWRWWWDDDASESWSNFTQDEYNKLVSKQTINLSQGKGQVSFSAGEQDWGRFLILVRDAVSGHVTGRFFYVDDDRWQSRSMDDQPSAATMLSFTSSKPAYEVGEEVVLTIPSSMGSRILLSLENGSRVLETQWHDGASGQTKIRFKATSDMAPNMYANVSLIQPHAQTVNDLPIRLYGVIPISVTDKKTKLSPQIQVADVVRPEQNMAVTVSEASGKSMVYTLAVVDDGLLDLTRFKTPDPHAALYAREALGVKSFDLYDQVIGAWAGGLERILTIGGDESAKPTKPGQANRFKPVVRFIGPFQLKGGKRTHQISMPAYVGSVRVMVVAGEHGSYGAAEKTVTVRKPLMILPTFPRMIGPGEQLRIPVTVMAMEGSVRQVHVRWQANNLFELTGPATQTVSFTAPGEQLVYFDVRTLAATGVGEVTLKATSGKEVAQAQTEIDVRNPNPRVTQVEQIELAPGQSWSGNLSPIGVNSSAVLEVGVLPGVNLRKRLQYLIEYPHGCIEQTTSAVFPQLVLNQLVDLNTAQQAELKRNIQSGIARIRNMQLSSGGFSYWPGSGEADEWGTNYAGHFLLEAKRLGYTAADLLLPAWVNYQRQKANQWIATPNATYGNDLVQAYRLYTLAANRTPELGAMNRMKVVDQLSAEAKWRLAAAYALVGQLPAAEQLTRGLSVSFPARTDPGASFGSALRDQAMVLEALTIMNKRQAASSLVRDVAAQLGQDNWYSTQTTAYALLSIARYNGAQAPSGAMNLSIEVGGQAQKLGPNKFLQQVILESLPASGKAASVKNNGQTVVYLRVVREGQPINGDSIRYANNPAVLNMQVSYLTRDGKPVDVTKLLQGTDFVARVTVTNPGKRGAYANLALTQVFPGGWEIINSRMIEGATGALVSSSAQYVDFRDDRVHTYFGLRSGETVTYYVALHAAYLGRYYLPATQCEAMYDNQISAGVSGKWIEVVATP